MDFAPVKISGFFGQPSRHITGKTARRLLEQVHQERAAGEKFMLARPVAARPGDENDLRQAGIFRVHFKRNFRLIDIARYSARARRQNR